MEERMSRSKPWRNVPPATVTLAGIPVKRELVERLARQVDEPTATKLARAIENETRVLGLEIEDRERLLRALEDARRGWASSRATLTQEYVASVRGEM
jgi:hypothetical protein